MCTWMQTCIHVSTEMGFFFEGASKEMQTNMFIC